jgi:hypothetical protein
MSIQSGLFALVFCFHRYTVSFVGMPTLRCTKKWWWVGGEGAKLLPGSAVCSPCARVLLHYLAVLLLSKQSLVSVA